MLGLIWLKILNADVLLALVIDMFYVLIENSGTSFRYYFLQVMLITLSILMGCFNTLDRSSRYIFLSLFVWAGA